jgi:amidase
MFPPTAGIANPLWQQGPMARSVADLGLILPIITGEDGYDAGVISMPLQSPQAVKLKNLRVAYYTDNGIVSSTLETQQTVHKTAQALAEAGLIVEEKRPPHIEHSFALLRRLVPDSSAGLRRFLQTIGTTEFHRGTQQVIDESRQHASSTTEYMGWLYQLDLFHNGMLAFMQQYDVILSPTCAFPALSHDEAYDEEKYPAFSYAATYNLTGWPASVVRAGSSPNGLPIGVQIVARPWREDVALAVAQHIETAFGSWQAPAEKIVNALG